MPLDHGNKGVEEKQKQKQKQKQKRKQKQTKKQSGLLFFGLDVFFWVGLSFSILVWPLFLFLPVVRQPIRTGPNVCCAPVPIGGNAVRVGSSDQTRILSPD